MQLLEKIFQRNDKFYLLVYYFTIGLSLNFSTHYAYYIRNKNWDLPEIYFEGSILITLIFWAMSIFKPGRTNEDRYLKGTVQWFKVEFVFLVQTFLIAVLIFFEKLVTDHFFLRQNLDK